MTLLLHTSIHPLITPPECVKVIGFDSYSCCFFNHTNSHTFPTVYRTTTTSPHSIKISLQHNQKSLKNNTTLFEYLYHESFGLYPPTTSTGFTHFVANSYENSKQILCYSFDNKLLFIKSSYGICKVHLTNHLRQLSILRNTIICLYDDSLQILSKNGKTLSSERFPKPTYTQLFNYLAFNSYISVSGTLTINALTLLDGIRTFFVKVLESPQNVASPEFLPTVQPINVYGALVCFVYFPFNDQASFLIVDNAKRINKTEPKHIKIKVEPTRKYNVLVIENLVILTNEKTVSVYDLHCKNPCVLLDLNYRIPFPSDYFPYVHSHHSINAPLGTLSSYTIDFHSYYKYIEHHLFNKYQNDQTIKSYRHLLRRTGATNVAVDIFFQMLQMRYDLTFVSKALSFINAVNRRKEQSAITMDTLKYHILLALPITGDFVDVKYTIDVLLEYIQVWCGTNDPLDINILLLLIEAIDNIQLYSLLLNLITFGIFPDNEVIAIHIIQLQQHFPPVFQLGLDMLKRLECHQTIVDTLSAQGYLQEALLYATNHNIPTSLGDNLPLFDPQTRRLLHQLEQTSNPHFHSNSSTTTHSLANSTSMSYAPSKTSTPAPLLSGDVL
ncbi:Mic1 domain-containing protein [Entamoeba marina]